jgi:hypothetical protein
MSPRTQTVVVDVQDALCALLFNVQGYLHDFDGNEVTLKEALCGWFCSTLSV